ncbi:MAG: DUF1015 domain-containing protein [Clostridia bacterium]|nr:DUF1015 domain-containing protein [Clostridia bacterium]
MKPCFFPADILLPDFGRTDPRRWAVVACDQFTSEPEYWASASDEVGDAPSTLRLTLPEVWLNEAETRIPGIHAAMEEALREVLICHPGCMICLDRTQSDGTHRLGLIGAVDLEAYDYTRGAQTPIRATEGTVLERIPPRVAIRRGAPLELPHVMLLIDDPDRKVIEPIFARAAELETIYDFDLMLGGGHVCGRLMDEAACREVTEALASLATPEEMEKKYGAPKSPLLFAVGDGNHSLASAKAAYEEIKAKLGDAALEHPARYALAEVVNLHDSGLNFEPIYRVVFGVEPEALLNELTAYAASLSGNVEGQVAEAVWAGGNRTIELPHAEQQLTVGTLQAFLDLYLRTHPEAEVDYIHGEGSLRALAGRPNAVGFLFEGMKKDQLFKSVLFDGALPRKTFSMGHAEDKRYYLEARKIR